MELRGTDHVLWYIVYVHRGEGIGYFLKRGTAKRGPPPELRFESSLALFGNGPRSWRGAYPNPLVPDEHNIQ